MAAAADNFLAALTPDAKAKTVFAFADPERRDWHFIPRERKGLQIKEMTYEQRLLAQALLATGLSHRGYSKAVSIMSLETVLAELEKGSRAAPCAIPSGISFRSLARRGKGLGAGASRGIISR